MLLCGGKVREVGYLCQEDAPFAGPPRAGEDNMWYRALGGKRNCFLSHYNAYCLSCFSPAWHLVTKEELGLLPGYVCKSNLL